MQVGGASLGWGKGLRMAPSFGWLLTDGSHKSDLIRKPLEQEGTCARESMMKAGTWSLIWTETVRKCLGCWVCHRNIPLLQHCKYFPLQLLWKWLLNLMLLLICR